MSEPDYDDYQESDLPQCPHCDGGGEVPCYCGGDLCVCENDGYDSCHVCGGEGVVTEERYDRYMANQRRNAEMMRAVMAKIERERSP
jgi:hypothetical protein